MPIWLYHSLMLCCPTLRMPNREQPAAVDIRPTGASKTQSVDANPLRKRIAAMSHPTLARLSTSAEQVPGHHMQVGKQHGSQAFLQHLVCSRSTTASVPIHNSMRDYTHKENRLRKQSIACQPCATPKVHTRQQYFHGKFPHLFYMPHQDTTILLQPQFGYSEVANRTDKTTTLLQPPT